MSRVTYFVCRQDFSDTHTLKAILAMASALILADHLRCHPVFMPLNLEVCIELTEATSVLLYLDLLQALLKDR